MIYPHNYERKIGIDSIRLLLKERCLSSLGKLLVDEMAFCKDAATINEWLEQVREFRRLRQERADVPLVQAGMGADPAAVIFDAVKSANARGYDMVIADTAGRLHNKKGLMDELSKISRSVKKASPEASLEVLLVLDAITGQNAISQAEEFCKAANATGVVLTKLDGTPRGGCAVSVWENLGLPIRFIGVGEKIDDLMEFDAQTFVESLLPESALQKDGKKEEGESEA